MKHDALILPMALLCVLVFGFSVQAQRRAARPDPKAGVWRVVGKDAEGLGWRGSIRITTPQRSSGNLVGVRGYFDWFSFDRKTSGREFVAGTFHRDSGSVALRGYAIRNRKGEMSKTSYRAFVSRSGRSIERGRWFGKDVVKGNWTAKWLSAK